MFKVGLNKPKEHKIFFDVSEVYPNRYLHGFLKLFDLQDYTVYIPKDKKIILELSKGKTGEALFKKWLLNE
ncbi:hypothetical protein C723_2776 [Christiangramia flava JLT2011]|uniref:Uncharacterized protein n=1 Tax=Christiangramia flava JLT2011 TaxID=1229726 RepID=A0A1L7I681_9FLAO|nr:hypothetical protein GRFL_2383 [Christiangramia flava JLT2011]OSS38292.1 hypothetical protein C723_2776 [Christiangramia flava JLT2011]